MDANVCYWRFVDLAKVDLSTQCHYQKAWH